MKRLIPLTLTALALTACNTTTDTNLDVEACHAAFDAAQEIFDASIDVTQATIPVLDNIAPALEAAMNHNSEGLQPLITATNDLTQTTGDAADVVNNANYETHRDQCLNQ